MVASREARLPLLWEQALRDAAGPLSAFIAPRGFGLATLNVASTETDVTDPFRDEIQRRLDLGRAAAVAEFAEGVSGSLSTSYRHEVRYYRDEIRGKIHMPRYLLVQAQSPDKGVPAIAAERQYVTPENLLVSEAIRRSLVVSQSWADVGGAEQVFARNLSRRLLRVEAQHPWNDLRRKPRPSLQNLLRAVRDRVVSRIVPREPIATLDRLLSPQGDGASAFATSAGVLSMLVSQDTRFQDRVFELLCLAWIWRAVRTVAETLEVFPANLSGGGNNPILVAQTRRGEVSIFFQTGQPLPVRNWSRRRGSREFRAIPDMIGKLTGPGETYTVLIDAKNRGRDDSEVLYKLLGYKENTHVGTAPFLAIAIFPSTESSLETVKLAREAHSVWLLRVPLDDGQRIITRWARTIL